MTSSASASVRTKYAQQSAPLLPPARSLTLIPAASFHDRIFGILDQNGDGFIDFAEFVASVCDFGSMDHKSLLRFAFTMFDSDGNGVITRKELEEMVTDIYGANWKQKRGVAAMVDAADVSDGSRDGVLNFEDFCELDRRLPSLLLPAFAMQNRIRERVLGTAHWEKVYRERAKHGPGYSVFDILTAVQAARREKARSAENGKLGAAAGERYVPEYMKNASYVPEVSANPRAKAERRRSQIEAEDALKRGDKELAKKLLAEADALASAEAAQQAALVEAESREEKQSRIEQGLVDDGTEEGRKRAEAAGRRASVNAARRKSAVEGAAARRQSALGITAGTASGQIQDVQSRRRSSVANAQDRAAAIAMRGGV